MSSRPFLLDRRGRGLTGLSVTSRAILGVHVGFKFRHLDREVGGARFLLGKIETRTERAPVLIGRGGERRVVAFDLVPGGEPAIAFFSISESWSKFC